MGERSGVMTAIIRFQVLSRRLAGLVVLGSVVLCAAPMPASAGTGTLAGGKLDLTIYVEDEAADLSSLHSFVGTVSQRLYDATEKQVQLGTITLTKCPDAKLTADVWMLKSNSPTCAARGNGCQGSWEDGQMGAPNTHIYIVKGDQSDGIFGLYYSGSMTFIHELGHYVFHLYDEYKGVRFDSAMGPPQFVEFPNGSPKHCVDDRSSVACIMDAGASVHADRHEFCTDAAAGFAATTHRVSYPGGSTYPQFVSRQQYENGGSCWHTIASLGYGIVAPSVAPVGDGSGAGVPAIIDMECGPTSLCLDRSGSMDGSPIDQLRQAATDLVASTPRGRSVGLVSFSDDAALDAPLTLLNTASDEVPLTQSIGRLTANGSTNIGAALRASMAQCIGSGAPPGTIVLMTDGE